MIDIFFNSAIVFFITIPLIVFISALLLKNFIKNRFLVLSIILIAQLVLYYGYSFIICNMKIADVYLDYVIFIIINTLIFGYLGILISNFFNKNKQLKH